MTANAIPLRYTRWMVRDLLLGPGLWMLLVAALTAWVAIVVTTNVTSSVGVVVINGVPAAIPEAGPIFNVHRVGLVLVLLATAGIVSRDLAAGYYRVLFTKPVNPPAYYFMRWLLGGAAVMTAIMLMDGILAVRLHDDMPGLVVAGRVGLFYLLVGGLVFFLSTLTRYDWIAAGLVMFGQSGIGTLRSLGLWSTRTWDVVYAALPPFHLVRLQDPIASWSDLWHAAVYGTGLVLAGLAILRWRPLGSGSRD
jgi:hypothetical protein